MRTRVFGQCAHLGRTLARALRQRLAAATTPAGPAVVTGALADLVRSRPALIAEKAYLRQQLLIRLRQNSDKGWQERLHSASVAALTAAGRSCSCPVLIVPRP